MAASVNGNAAKEPCAVATGQLALVLRQWVARWERDHPDPNTANGCWQEIGAITILRERTDLLEPPGVPRRTIYNILGVHYAYTRLSTADLLLSAIEEPHAFYDGRVSVVPNPWLKPERRIECCGTSDI